MKILISTGYGRLHLLRTAEELYKLGHDVHVVQGLSRKSIFPISSLSFLNLSYSRINNVYTSRFPDWLKVENDHRIYFLEELFYLFRKYLYWPPIKGWVAYIFWSLYSFFSGLYMLKIRPDAVHIRSGALRSFGVFCAKLIKAKILIDHSLIIPHKAYALGGEDVWIHSENIFWKSVIKDIKRSDFLIVNSSFIKKWAKTITDEKKIKVAELGVSSCFLNLKDDITLHNPIRLLFTGTFSYRKGAIIIIELMRLLNKSSLDFVLHIFGTIPNDVSRIIDKNGGLSKLKIQFHGRVPQPLLKKEFFCSDIFVFPTFLEGCSSSVVEALASGVPVITTLNSGTPCTHFGDAILVKPGDVESLRDAVLQLSFNDELRESISRAAKIKFSCWTWEKYQYNLSTIYKEIL